MLEPAVSEPDSLDRELLVRSVVMNFVRTQFTDTGLVTSTWVSSLVLISTINLSSRPMFDARLGRMNAIGISSTVPKSPDSV